MSDDEGGALVRNAWVEWAKTQPDPKPSWLVPWAELDEQSKSADRAIFQAIACLYEKTILQLESEVEILEAELTDDHIAHDYDSF